MRRNNHMGTNTKFQQVTYIPFSCLDTQTISSKGTSELNYTIEPTDSTAIYSTVTNTNFSQKLIEHSLRHNTFKSTNQISKNTKEKKFLNALSVTRETSQTPYMLEMYQCTIFLFFPSFLLLTF